MARFASTFPRYEEMVVESTAQPPATRLLAPGLKPARGTKLYAKLKAIDLDAERAGLFNNFSAQEPQHQLSYVAPMSAAHQIPDRDQIRPDRRRSTGARGNSAMPRYSRIGVAGDPNLYAIGEFADPDENLAPRGAFARVVWETATLPRRLPMPSDRFLISNILSCAA
jgi:hypothetical protein